MNKLMKKRILLVLMAVVLVTGLVVAGCAAPAPEGPIEITLVTFLPTTNFIVAGWGPFIEKVNAQAGGALTVKLLGGPEVIAGLDQPRAVKEGVVDIALVPTSYYTDMVPAVDIISLARGPFPEAFEEELKPGGFHDAMVELHHEYGVHTLGRQSPRYGLFYNIVNKEVKTPADLNGLRCGITTSKYLGALDELGMSLVVVPAPEAYVALETGVIDVFNGPLVMMSGLGLGEVCSHGIYQGILCDNMQFLMNLDTWNGLSKEQQEILSDAALEVCYEMGAGYQDNLVTSKASMEAAGMTFVEFSSADAKYYEDVYFNTELENYKAQWPEETAELAPLLGYTVN